MGRPATFVHTHYTRTAVWWRGDKARKSQLKNQSVFEWNIFYICRNFVLSESARSQQIKMCPSMRTMYVSMRKKMGV